MGLISVEMEHRQHVWKPQLYPCLGALQYSEVSSNPRSLGRYQNFLMGCPVNGLQSRGNKAGNCSCLGYPNKENTLAYDSVRELCELSWVGLVCRY
jgi:hypothetical protein